MNDYCIIDSNSAFATALADMLGGTSCSMDPSPKDWRFEDVLPEISEQTWLLISAECTLRDSFQQEQKIIGFLFWCRFIAKKKNPVVIYSYFSPTFLLKNSANHLIAFSPGCYFVKKPFSNGVLSAIKEALPLESLSMLRPFIKPKVDEILSTLRHRYANYACMAMMLAVARSRHRLKHDSDIMDHSILTEFKASVDHHLLRAFYEPDFKGLSSFSNLPFVPQTKRIILVDDLAIDGWQPILSQILYGRPDAQELASLSIIRDAKKQMCLDETLQELEQLIKLHKPHLILLDLKLDDELGKVAVSELSGAKILEGLKTKSVFKKIPVLMFTASSNAENVKTLLELGAEAVWTKPGIDNIVDKKEINQRYDKLVELVSAILEPSYLELKAFNDNDDPNFTYEQVDFEKLRNLLFKRLDWAKYRMLLYTDQEKSDLVPEPYRSADLIYLDANSLLTGTKLVDYGQLISSVVSLSLLTAKSNLQFLANPLFKDRILPKVVVMNCVFDEVLKYAKKGRGEQKRLANGTLLKSDLILYRAFISAFVLKNLFNIESVRTELFEYTERTPDNRYKSGPWPSSALKDPKENVLADGYFLDEVSNVALIGRTKKFQFEEKLKIIVLTGDSDLTTKLEKFRDTKKNDLRVEDIKVFVKQFAKISI